jgi:glycosyltransferase involved in cell wall biosynthesis
MHVVHLSQNDTSGGAARAAYRIHCGLRELGVNSEMLVGKKDSDADSVVGPSGPVGKGKSLLRRRLDELPVRLYRSREEGADFYPNWVPDRLGNRVADLSPSVLNLHWISGGYMRLETVADFECPVVWTFPDMWPLTGGCHYGKACDKYRESCGRCPRLGSDRERDLSRYGWRRKRAAFEAVDAVVAPSRWLAECARASTVVADTEVRTIPYGLDVDQFKPVDPSVGRDLFDIPKSKQVILYGAIEVESERKGFEEFKAAVDHLSDSPLAGDVEIVTFGRATNGSLAVDDVPVRHAGFLHDEESLALLYSAADVMVVPSRQEAFGQTATEALACGTPVVAFDATGPRDIVDHERTGYLATPYEGADLATGIEWVLSENEDGSLSARAREAAVDRFDAETVAQAYQELYESL